ncbi:uncharacterized protein LOC17888543 isoform X2 [Capsella rubella]|uniref:uncharacterized protein LOC17888543 isoform X2 n=1 Tax=Capsella rubella TaxID=81985 RepID=UPI000CD5799F|nr:uncharacterized protein LOC17888543 isoform X2 [Capsella rubella]
MNEHMTKATKATKPRNLFWFCCLLMAFLFAYSASVQLNDPDWYFWFPLYTLACVVNLINCKRRIKQMMVRTALGLGLFLLVKVVAEDVITEKVGVLSLDLTHRVVREKVGSGLVIASMVLQLQQASSTKPIDFVIFGYGLPFWFFTVMKGEIKI